MQISTLCVVHGWDNAAMLMEGLLYISIRKFIHWQTEPYGVCYGISILLNLKNMPNLRNLYSVIVDYLSDGEHSLSLLVSLNSFSVIEILIISMKHNYLWDNKFSLKNISVKTATRALKRWLAEQCKQQLMSQYECEVNKSTVLPCLKLFSSHNSAVPLSNVFLIAQKSVGLVNTPSAQWGNTG